MPVHVCILSQYSSFMTEQNPPSMNLPVNTILKIQLKKSALPSYWTSSVSIIILVIYLLTFLQLTWQVAR